GRSSDPHVPRDVIINEQDPLSQQALAESDDALLDSWDVSHPATADEDEAGQSSGREQETMSAFETIGKMPYDFSPARLHCMELAEELAAHESAAS
ncbi:hypothetical protein ACP4J3_22480, partial [Streptomyces sp. UG1]